MLPITSDQVLSKLQAHIGREHGIHVRLLALSITRSHEDLEVAERQVRRIVVELRMQGHHICATPVDGYFMAANADELDQTCSFLHDRAMTTLAQVARMKNVSLPDLRGQLHLPT